MIATTISNSTREKPFLPLRMLRLILLVSGNYVVGGERKQARHREELLPPSRAS
jgi:hypothetical protein